MMVCYVWSLDFCVVLDAENAGPYRKGNLLDVLRHRVGVDIDPAPLGGRLLVGWGRGLGLRLRLGLNGDRFHGGLLLGDGCASIFTASTAG